MKIHPLLGAFMPRVDGYPTIKQRYYERVDSSVEEAAGGKIFWFWEIVEDMRVQFKR